MLEVSLIIGFLLNCVLVRIHAFFRDSITDESMEINSFSSRDSHICCVNFDENLTTSEDNFEQLFELNETEINFKNKMFFI